MERVNIKDNLLKVIFAMLASLLAISESNIKSIINDWLDDCRIIVEAGDIGGCKRGEWCAPIKLYTIGETLPDFRLRLHTREEYRECIDMAGIYFPGEIINDNLAVHPLASEFCKIDTATDVFCNIKNPDEAVITLNELSSNYNYVFEIDLSLNKQACPDLSAKPIDDVSIDEVVTIYSQPDKEMHDRLRCKVEASSWFNYVARQGDMKKFISLSIVIFLVMFVLAAFRKSGSDDNG